MKRTIVLLAILLLSFGLAHPFGSVDIYCDVDQAQYGGDDTLRIGIPATLDVYLENQDSVIGGMSLGIQVWGMDGATWQWIPDPGGNGLGASGIINITPDARLGFPLGTAFDMTKFLVTEQDIDEAGRDTVMGGGVAMLQGVPTGPLHHEYSYNFVPGGPGDVDPVPMLCFDSCFVPPSGAFVFVNSFGGAAPPTTLWGQGGKCYPVLPARNFCPEITGAPYSMSIDHCGSGQVTVTATDNEGNDIEFAIAGNTGGGTATVGASSGVVTYTPVAADVGAAVTITVGVTDAFNDANCNTVDIDVTVTNNPPTIDCGALYNPVGKGNTIIKTDIVGTDADACDALTYSLLGGPGSIDMVTGEYTWATTDLDIGSWTVCVGVSDGFDIDTCCFEVDVLLTEPWMIKIEKVHDALQGHFVDVDVCINKGSEIMGGFDFLIGYDASALAFTEATLGQWLVDCGWEYFTYRFNWNGNCGNGCPSGLLRVVGMAETNNGPNHPDWDCLTQFTPGDDCYECGTVIVTLTFFLSNDRTLECMFAPVRFYWMDCGDNVISTVSGDTLAINRYIYDIGSCQYSEMQDWNFGLPGYYGAPDIPCLEGDKVTPVRFVDFCNGGVDIVCADSIDARGDINVNGVANEIADAVMFTNYFISGLSAFGTHVEASIAASDVNADGIALSVADLVYLTRVIIGDANPYPKPLPETPVTISARGGVINYNSPVEMGAALLTFTVNGDVGTPQLGSGASSMDIKYAREGDELRVLVYNIGSEAIAAGENVLVTVPGNVELTGAEVASYDGLGLDALVRNIPREFTVQNSPNPFNPKTRIALSLPEASDWSVKIYNITGQLVNDFAGNADAGQVEVIWNGTDKNGNTVASGVYFYKAEAGQFSATKKMVLMK